MHVVLKKSLRRVLIVSAIGIGLASCQGTNSNDVDTPAAGGSACDGTQEFCDALTVIQERCVSCHSGVHMGWGAFTTEAQWTSSGRVVAGAPSSSTLIVRLRNHSTSGDMPPAGAIPDDEYRTLIDWVSGI